MPRVLVLCTGNSCRSPIAEAGWRHLAAGSWEVASAGTRPAGAIHPMALAVLRELAIPVDLLRSKSVAEFGGQRFDLVVTVCGAAREECPAFPNAGETLHWAFEDPALAEGSPEERLAVFRRVRDQILAAIAGQLRTPGRRFRNWMEQSLGQSPSDPPLAPGDAFRRLVERTAELVDSEPDQVWQRLPSLIREQFLERGWEWNGIYVRDGDTLRLASAAGPPVCTELSLRGGDGCSGMCFDALLMNQTVAARDPHRWPGYVSCDAESGLSTAAGMACPIRDRRGVPIAVWDLDSTQPLASHDPARFDRYFATLSAILRPVPALLLGRPRETEAGATHDAHPEDAATIKLDQYLKWRGLVDTGGRAKLAVQAGEVKVNGTIETRRGRRLHNGDRVEFQGATHIVAIGPR